VEWLEAYRHNGRLLPLQPFHLVGAAMPWLREKIGTFAAYANASMEEIHGETLKKAKQLSINWLQSTVFLNRGSRFEAKTLPIEAQFAPAFGVCVADFDGDGAEDLFLSQNLFAVPADTSRYDAGRGLWLRGKGDGTFSAVPGQESGIKIYGEQRGAAVCDYDADGRMDIAVAQNGAPTKLLRNVKGKPGLRVRLDKPVGAILRLKNGERLGPAREIHTGSGYWSQDSAVPVLHGDWATHVEVRWPGGRTTTHEIPKGAKELQITN
jgi:enediyne biosynthesis protein E4